MNSLLVIYLWVSRIAEIISLDWTVVIKLLCSGSLGLLSFLLWYLKVLM